jgi:hypothetical protein
MEARVLRAALSAAIRVTVSTSLIGCGGVTTGGQGDAPPSESKTPVKSGHPTGTGGSGSNTAGAMSAATSGSGGLELGEGGSMLAGTPAGGVPGTSGMPNAGGMSNAGGVPGAGGVPNATDACEAAYSCVSDLQALQSDTSPQLPTTERTTECCQLIIGSKSPWGTPLLCGETTFNGHAELLWPCCAVLQSPQDTACTPWGPPVPPELDLEQLLSWAAV